MDEAQIHQQFTAIMTQLGSLSSLPGKVDGVREKQEELCEKQDIMTERFHTKEIEDAKSNTEQDGRLKQLEKDVDAIGTKVRIHVADHWKHYLATAGLVGIILAAAGALHG